MRQTRAEHTSLGSFWPPLDAKTSEGLSRVQNLLRESTQGRTPVRNRLDAKPYNRRTDELTLAQFARVLRVSIPTLTKAIEKGQVPFEMHGSCYRFPIEMVIEFIEGRDR